MKKMKFHGYFFQPRRRLYMLSVVLLGAIYCSWIYFYELEELYFAWRQPQCLEDSRENIQIDENLLIRINFDTDRWLYETHSPKIKLYWWARNITVKKQLDRHVYFHTYWKFQKGYSDDMKLPSHLPLIINSYLATQDLEHTTLIFWSNYDVRNHIVLSKYFRLPQIQTKVYTALEMAKGTTLEGNSRVLSREDSKVYADGDLMRILVLYHYGGVYFDADTILLRDFTPILYQQFNYYWGSTFTKENSMNGAVMHAWKHSKWMKMLIENIPTSCAGGFCWGRWLYARVHYCKPEMTIFPCFFFDPDWYDDDNGHNGEFYFELKKETKGYKLDDLYDGIFAYHWHGRFKIDKAEEGSKRDKFKKMHIQIVRQRIPGFDPQ